MSALEKATENYRRRVGAQIRTARDDAELTLDQLAEKTFSSRQHLIKLERGDHSPTKRMLSAIALATGKDISFFNGEKDEGEEDDEEADPVFGRAMQAMFDRAVDRAVSQRLRRTA